MLSFPPGTKMVHFPGFASRPLLYSGADIPTLFGISLEDSEIPGSQPVCGSPRLIAAYHVLRRLPSPRHPPCALSSLTIKFAPLETRAGRFLALVFLPVVVWLSKITRSGLCRKSKTRSRALDFRRTPGGGKRARTADPLLAKQVLFQLSYTPGSRVSRPPDSCRLAKVWWA